MGVLNVYLDWRGNRSLTSKEPLPHLLGETSFWNEVAGKKGPTEPPYTTIPWRGCELRISTDGEAMLYTLLFPDFEGRVRVTPPSCVLSRDTLPPDHMDSDGPETLYNHHLTDAGLQHFSCLRSLDFSGCWMGFHEDQREKETGLYQNSGSQISERGFEHLTNLTSLKLDYCEMNHPENHARNPLPELPKLVYLRMVNARMVTTRGVSTGFHSRVSVDFLAYQSNLTSLDIRGTIDEDLDKISRYCPKLKSLQLSVARNGNESIPSIPSLNRLKITRKERDTRVDPFLTATETNSDNPQRVLETNPQLDSLELEEVKVSLDCNTLDPQHKWDLTQLTLRAVHNSCLKKMTNLRSLTLDEAKEVTDEDFKYLSSLTNLRLENELSITTRAFEHIPGLKSLTIDATIQADIDDSVLVHVKNLTSLSMPLFPNDPNTERRTWFDNAGKALSDSVLSQLGELVMLDIRNQAYVTEATLARIPTLRSVDVSGCTHIDVSSLKARTNAAVLTESEPPRKDHGTLSL